MKELRIRATTAAGVLGVVHERLDALTGTLGVALHADPQREAVRTQLSEIMEREADGHRALDAWTTHPSSPPTPSRPCAASPPAIAPASSSVPRPSRLGLSLSLRR